MHKPFLTTAALLTALAVALGAFGAHGLKQVLPAESLQVFETGVRYQFYHCFALLAAGMLYERFRHKWMVAAGYCFIGGIILFSGSLYLLTWIKASHAVGVAGIGILTPFGGLLFIAGWVLLALAFHYGKPNAVRSI